MLIFTGQLDQKRRMTGKKLNFVVHGDLPVDEAGFHEHPVGQLLFAEKGLLHIEYPDRKILLPTQYCSWIPPSKPHRLRAGSPNLFIRAIYSESRFCKNKVFANDAVFPLSNVLKEMIRYTAKWNDIQEDSVYETTFITAIRQMIPDEMASAIKMEVPVTEHPVVSRIVSYVNENFGDEIRIETVSKLFGLSGRTLHRLFVKELGQSFSTYLIFFRVIKAVELLTGGKHTIKEITYLVGYNSIPSFSSIFKQVIGDSPQGFLKKLT
jgi:AraC-like DNA-binding protein/mannose-6-phosphate isomerase-like protein (cupin superfamily)